MKLIKKMRKGFTLIELVVVIAVIAILSAVSVVSYIAITNKAKQSADEQAVRQMNTILAANSVMDLKSINDVFAAFEENDLNVENYKPLSKDRYFFWDSTTNQIVYTDKNYVVIYPESLKGSTKGSHQWYSLTQSLAKTEIENAKVNVDGVQTEVKDIDKTGTTWEYDFAVESAEQLYTIGQELKDAMLGNQAKNTTKEVGDYKIFFDGNLSYVVGDVKVVLTEDLDLMGGAFNFCVKGNFTLEGNGHTIKGIVNNRDFIKGKSTTLDGIQQTEYYGTGLLGYIAHGTADFSKVTVENCAFGFSKGKGAGLVGYASDAVLNFEDVVVKNSTMEGFEHSVGGFVADTQGDDKNTTKVEKVEINFKGTNKLENCYLKLTKSDDTVSAAKRECYGAGYLVGRQTGGLDINSVSGGTFTQSGNSKEYESGNPLVPSGKEVYKYWDDTTGGKAVTIK